MYKHNKKPVPSKPGIYIHLPFCASKCAYCSFYSIPSLNRAEEYLSALLRELGLRSGPWREHLQGGAFASIYFGGGTPSILPPDSIPRLLDKLRQRLPIAADAEISCEANPDSLSHEHARAWAAAGVNRISIGLQSANESMLRTLGRRHTAGQFLAAADAAHAAGIGNINGDMMFGIPGQSIAMLDDTMALLHQAGVQHVSCYGLQLEEGTPLHEHVQTGALTLPDEDETGNMYAHIKAALPALGYARYEISNFSRPGHECRHNLNYWANGDYLALGAAAAGAIRIDADAAITPAAPVRKGANMAGQSMLRYTNTAHMDSYIADTLAGRLAAMQPIPREEEMFESIMLATRTLRGLDLSAFARRYGVDFLQHYEKAAKDCLSADLAVVEGDCFRLTDRGMDIQNSVLLSFMGR